MTTLLIEAGADIEAEDYEAEDYEPETPWDKHSNLKNLDLVGLLL